MHSCATRGRISESARAYSTGRSRALRAVRPPAPPLSDAFLRAFTSVINIIIVMSTGGKREMSRSLKRLLYTSLYISYLYVRSRARLPRRSHANARSSRARCFMLNRVTAVAPHHTRIPATMPAGSYTAKRIGDARTRPNETKLVGSQGSFPLSHAARARSGSPGEQGCAPTMGLNAGNDASPHDDLVTTFVPLNPLISRSRLFREKEMYIFT